MLFPFGQQIHLATTLQGTTYNFTETGALSSKQIKNFSHTPFYVFLILYEHLLPPLDDFVQFPVQFLQ